MCAFDRGMCAFAQGRCPWSIHRGGGGVVSSGVRVMLTPRGYAMLPFNQGPGLSCTHMEPLSGPGFMGPAVYAAARYFAASH